MQQMRAAVADRYGGPDRLRVELRPCPRPAETEVLVRICAAAVCRGDTHLLSGRPYLVRLSGYGVRRPKWTIPGQSFSGRIEAIGAAVSDHRVGDLVFGEIGHGAFAEFATAAGDRIARKPEACSHADAAALALSGITALQGLRDVGRVTAGEHVLVNGASGSVGTLAVQIAKALGAKVTAVCGARHGALIGALGADEVIDYASSDFTRSSERYDVILDLVANRRLADCRRILKPGGRFVAAALPAGADWIGPLRWIARVATAGIGSNTRFAMLVAKPNRPDLETLARFVAGGQLKPVIERRCELGDIALAYGHVASGRSQGATVVDVAGC